eukprot:TRINITY_DN5_c0_g1_i3.p1 TRINITY_DN5_c0_g1~~TRINITY_DN5_c0_g1_i3.p1  ORF type:complete len:472 (+),score=197.16 TRINITY_DN5_c0_g1_i3:69-1484(+)
MTEPTIEVEAGAAPEAHEHEVPPRNWVAVAIMGLFQVLVLMMFGFFVAYSDDLAVVNETQKDFELSRLYPFFQDVHVMVFIGFGFLMTFLHRYSMSSVGFNLFIAAQMLQWTMLSNGFWHRVFSEKYSWHEPIRLTVADLVTADFGAATVLISMGAMLGKCGPVQLMLMGMFEILVYSINESIGVYEYQAVDMGGSMYVHMFGAFFGVACSSMYMPASRVAELDSKKKLGASRTTDTFAMIGTLFLWMFWPSFNGALATGAARNRVVINTVLAISSSCTATFVVSYLCRGKLSMVDVQNATLAGGVAVGSSSDLVIDAWPAMLVGSIAGVVSCLGYIYLQPALEKLGIHDTCGVLNLHGIPGMIGAIGGAVSAAAEDGDTLYGSDIASVFPARANGGRSASKQGAMQAACMFTTLGISIAGGLLVGLLLRLAGDSLDFKGNDGIFEDSKYWEIENEEDEEAHPMTAKEGAQ